MADNLFNKPLIRVENLFKIFGENDVKKPTVNAIDNVSLEINRGDVMVIIGPSGSGKSTFLRSLNLLEKPSSGHTTSTDRRWEWCSSTSICSRISRSSGI